MSSGLTLLIACAIVALFVFAVRRANELFCVNVEDGRARHVRGRLPPALLHDIQDVVEARPVPSAILRVVTESGAPRLLPDPGLSEAELQQLRNVLGRFNLVQIRGGRLPPSGRG